MRNSLFITLWGGSRTSVRKVNVYQSIRRGQDELERNSLFISPIGRLRSESAKTHCLSMLSGGGRPGIRKVNVYQSVKRAAGRTSKNSLFVNAIARWPTMGRAMLLSKLDCAERISSNTDFGTPPISAVIGQPCHSTINIVSYPLETEFKKSERQLR